jgi:hypothetical protein
LFAYFRTFQNDNAGIVIVRRCAWVDVAVWGSGLACLACFTWSELAARRANEAARAALIAAEPWRESPDWRGMKLRSSISAPQPVWTAFESDPPVPEKRQAMSTFFRSSRHRLVAWDASIDRVTPHADGWEAVVTVHPRFSGTASTTAGTIETWEISKSGNARCLKCQSVGGLCFVD